MKECPVCSFENPDNQQVCMSCSEPLTELSAPGMPGPGPEPVVPQGDNAGSSDGLTAFERTTFFQNGYRVEKQLGEGTSAQVYLVCRHDFTGKTRRAVKHIRKTLKIDNLRLSRCGNNYKAAKQSIRQDVDAIKREVTILSSVRGNPYITAYVDHQIDEQEIGDNCHLNIWLLKEYYEDVLSNRLTPGNIASLSTVSALQILKQIGEALIFLHRQNIIHRDIKPDNILLDSDSGQAKLDDFGQAKATEPDMTHTVGQIGTPLYSAPEIDARLPNYDGKKTDIFSLGAVFYECVTGKAPFAVGLTRNMNQDRMINTILGNKSAHRIGEEPFLNNRFLDVVYLATAPRPEDRYPSMEEMLADINKLFDPATHVEEGDKYLQQYSSTGNIQFRQQAEANFRFALELDPGNQIARNRLASM